MKSKFYVAALLGLTFAACNNEEMLTEEAPMAKSSVVFNVSMDELNADSRATWGGSGYTLTWLAEDADRLSFFHGITNNQGSVTGAQNAIYKAESTDGEGVKFTTHSMINPGLGIMVYPCDTVFNYKGSNLYYKLPQEQTAETNLLIPFMSNFINIAEFNAIKGDGAGYAKNYDIALKQIGTQFTLDADWEGENLAKIEALSNVGTILPINVVSSELRGQNNFTGEVEIKITNNVPSYNSKITGRDKWANVSEAVYSGRYAYDVIKTKAVKGLEISEFTLLPYSENTGSNGQSASVKINTRYGSVTIKGNDKVWENTGDDKETNPKITVTDGIQNLQELTNHVKNSVTSKFNGEKVGGHPTRHIDVDLANLDMSDVHIKNDKHLHDIILVHDALQKGQAVTFTIDGDANGVFEMSTATVAMLNERSEIKVNPCQEDGEKCTKIVLTDATEVPSFKFMTGKFVEIELAAENTAWTWTTGAKNMYNVWKLTNKGTLDVSNNAVVEANAWTGEGSHDFGFVNDGTININSGVAKQVNNLTNNGIINIAENAEYYNRGTFVNEAKSLTVQGKINNSGVFGNIDEGVINNYGYIKQMTASSKTFITNNQTDKVQFATPWSSTNKYGTIELYDNADDNYSVSNEDNQGFIMITTTAETVTAEEIGVEANYVKIAGDCTSLDFTRTASENVRVLFIEIASNKEVVWTTEGSIIRGLKVNDGCKLYIKKGNKVEVVGASYVKGKIYKGGEFTTTSFVSYFGSASDTTDSSNVIKWN